MTELPIHPAPSSGRRVAVRLGAAAWAHRVLTDPDAVIVCTSSRPAGAGASSRSPS